MGQKHKKSPTESYLQEKDTFFVPKTPKNEFLCNVELLLSGGIYKRRLSDKIAIGIGFNLLGVAAGIPWFNGDNLGAETPKTGFILSYKINKKLYYEFFPQFVIFLNSFNDFNTESYNSYGVENGLFLKLKKFDLGITIYSGRILDNYPKHEWKWTTYNSLIVLRKSIKQW